VLLTLDDRMSKSLFSQSQEHLTGEHYPAG
jgi:hypothetical protein